MAPKIQSAKAKITKWGCVQLKSFCMAKETINQWKKQMTG
jgi:hypothetical protein